MGGGSVAVIFADRAYFSRRSLRLGHPFRSVFATATEAVKKLDEDESTFYSIESEGGKQRLRFISEAGLYTLILHYHAKNTLSADERRV
jgi:prophage antirepressor-like protein